MHLFKNSTSIYCEISVNSFEVGSSFEDGIELKNTEFIVLFKTLFL